MDLGIVVQVLGYIVFGKARCKAVMYTSMQSFPDPAQVGLHFQVPKGLAETGPSASGAKARSGLIIDCRG